VSHANEFAQANDTWLTYPGPGRNLTEGELLMNETFLKLFVKLQNLKTSEEGQDLVEYALLVALIALVCVTGVSKVATAVNSVFTNISSSLS